jgi:hypothetical protein
MNFRAVVLSSVAALSFGSASYAADAIVAAEPEPMEYVRVCDAFGAGFFYIPGSETCLKIGGYVRFETDFGRAQSGSSDWDSFTRAQLDLDTRSDTELGALRGFIGLRGNADSSSSRGVNVDQAFIEVGGLKVGYFYSWWDDDLSGETDILSSNTTQYNAVRYTYTAGAFYAGIAAEELEGRLAGELDQTDSNNLGITSAYIPKLDNNVGVSGTIGFAMGPVTANVIGSYDTDAENGAVRGIASAKIGPGTASIAGVWASGANAYYEESEWTVAAEYALAVNDKLSITPGFQYFGTVDVNASGDFTGSRDAWRAGVTLDYKLAENLTTKIAANYQDIDGSSANGGGDTWTGFFRLQRGF